MEHICVSNGGRPPVSTYKQALAWLVVYGSVEKWIFDGAASLPPEARLVCDIFWISEAHLRRDVAKVWGAL